MERDEPCDMLSIGYFGGRAVMGCTARSAAWEATPTAGTVTGTALMGEEESR